MARSAEFSGALAALLLVIAPLHAAAQNAGETPAVDAAGALWPTTVPSVSTLDD